MKYFFALLSAVTALESFAQDHPAANPALDFKVKFDRQRENGGAAFKIGEKISARTILSIRNHQAKFLVALGDIRASDTFIIALNESENPGLESALRQYLGFPIQVVVEITGEGKYVVSNMFDYPVKLVSFSANTDVNPDSAVLAHLNPGDPITLKGEILEANADYAMIQTSDRGIFKVEIGEVTFPIIEETFDENIENQDGKNIEIGDTVIVRARVGRSHGVSADWCRSFYLVKPSTARLALYERIRKSAASGLEHLKADLASADFLNARKTYSRIVKNELSSDERTKLLAFLDQIPQGEKPIVLLNDARSGRYEINTLNALFEADLEAMTEKEYLEFIYKWSRREVSAIAGVDGDETYFFRTFSDLKIDPRIQTDIFLKAAQASSQFLLKEALGGKTISFKDTYRLMQSLAALTYRTDFSQDEKIAKFTSDFSKSYFSLTGEQRRHFDIKWELDQLQKKLLTSKNEAVLKILNQ